ncbi:MAG TPA: hypothetical protein VFP35_00640 [Candidatus Saccharimonadales bacterium]|nr:hypothetical protein [Candidatus Saccharimonadales bacterium]
MMKKVLLIGRRHHGEKNNVHLLADGLRGYLEGAEADWAHWEDLLVSVRRSGVKVEIIRDGQRTDLAEFNLLITMGWSHEKLYSDLAHTVALYAGANGNEVWNSEVSKARSMTKVSQIFKAHQAGIAVPETIFSLDTAKAINHNFLPLPLIAKDPTASRGRRNFFVTSAQELEALPGKDCPLILQEYIENDSSDIRIITAGGQPALAFRRVGSGGHLHNTSAGAAAELIEIDNLPAELASASRHIAKLFNRELTGIDFIIDKNSKRYIFLEVNGMPQLSSGAFLDEKLKALAADISSRKETK